MDDTDSQNDTHSVTLDTSDDDSGLEDEAALVCSCTCVHLLFELHLLLQYCYTQCFCSDLSKILGSYMRPRV
jgi:hypothetical protein